MSSSTHTRTPTSSHKLNTGPDDIDNGNTDGKEQLSPMYTIPIADRPPHGPLFSKIFFPLLFNFGQIGINSAQILALPLLLIPVFGRGWFEGVIGWTKDGYGRLCRSSLCLAYLLHILGWYRSSDSRDFGSWRVTRRVMNRYLERVILRVTQYSGDDLQA